MSYTKFAQTYDSLMDKSLYLQWKQFVDLHAPQKVSLLELACGTGDLAKLLAKDYQIVASDLSENMLAIARDKVGDIPLLQVDMCDLSDLPTFDVITCFADSLCYLESPKAVQQTFSEVYKTLNAGGVYLFDVHSTYQMTTIFKDYQYQYVDDTTVFTWQSFVGEYPYSVEHELTCCQKLENGLYERYDEIHYQRTYSLEQWQEWLKQAGFVKIEISANYGQDEIDTTTQRWFFACYK